MTSKHEDSGSEKTAVDSTMTPSTPAKAAPSPEKPEAARTRFKVIAAFWAVIIFLGFPIWWKTTSIYRASLPIEDMSDWADGKVRLLSARDLQNVTLTDAMVYRSVALYFRWKSDLKLRLYQMQRPNICSEPHSTPWTISTNSLRITSG